ncbi:hypothetical protein IFM89_025939 [Coptis chinensis]|uniref:Calcineurin B-like protein n=1 Tax=Coptis chinensis TaxID=261450 RepID=A0A835LSX6_9MAGN|nr:hypothetical protein IFM89_025939 [Coptis chinensis]
MFQLKEMVLALLIESDLALTEDVVETIVDKTFTDADSKGDGRTNMHQMAARSLGIFHPNAPLEEKVAFAFRLYGLTQTGLIEREELKEMVLALLIKSDLTLTEDVVETIVDKTFTDADSKGDGRANMHQMAARNEEPCRHKDSGGLDEDIKVDSVGLQQLGSVEQEAEKSRVRVFAPKCLNEGQGGSVLFIASMTVDLNIFNEKKSDLVVPDKWEDLSTCGKNNMVGCAREDFFFNIFTRLHGRELNQFEPLRIYDPKIKQIKNEEVTVKDLCIDHNTIKFVISSCNGLVLLGPSAKWRKMCVCNPVTGIFPLRNLCCSNSATLENGRILILKVGNGYHVYDVQLQQLRSLEINPKNWSPQVNCNFLQNIFNCNSSGCASTACNYASAPVMQRYDPTEHGRPTFIELNSVTESASQNFIRNTV